MAEHYSNRGNQSFKKRRESPIIALKNFNNWIKSTLIHTWTRRDDFALDIGGGKGGDFNKWKKEDIWHLVLAGAQEGRFSFEPQNPILFWASTGPRDPLSRPLSTLSNIPSPF